MESVLPLVSAAFIPFIPDDLLRYVALAIAGLSVAGHWVRRTYQIAGLDTSLKMIEELFDLASKECTRNPRFIYQAALRLVEKKLAVSNLRTEMIEVKRVSWRRYPQFVRNVALSMTQCRREMKELRCWIQLELESARQQRYMEDISHKKAALNQIFPDKQMVDWRKESDWVATTIEVV
ncbi:hypothetical protein FB45DRAFT_1059390 [Roridomyces roridus]|uniref:Uncharacterized protein n=1 Tax=Roridomyces roridus TaxID=1738132 RepID=A0AAD7BRI1_9AGAR|nr:hypothetical protein FB45DRAFT_1059390 [Roridomyces roridus]